MRALISGCTFVIPINKSAWAPFFLRYAILSHDFALFQRNSARSESWWKENVWFFLHFRSHNFLFIFFKVGLSPSKKNCVICFIEIPPLKVMKYDFYFILKALFVLKIFKLMSWLFGHRKKMAWFGRYLGLISKFMTSQPGLKTIAVHILLNITKQRNQTMKDNQTMK